MAARNILLECLEGQDQVEVEVQSLNSGETESSSATEVNDYYYYEPARLERTNARLSDFGLARMLRHPGDGYLCQVFRLQNKNNFTLYIKICNDKTVFVFD